MPHARRGEMRGCLQDEIGVSIENGRWWKLEQANIQTRHDFMSVQKGIWLVHTPPSLSNR